jgi:hypothetical protein
MYEKLVDQLLASPAYGERMAMDWMDVARYADSDGYLDDKHRDFSPWRDWVIEAFNENMPYDQFVSWQLAGDLIPEATQESILATAFNRLHRRNSEAGIVFEEYRTEYVAGGGRASGAASLAGSFRAGPHNGGLEIVSAELLQLSMDEVVDERGRNLGNGAIDGQRDAANLPMMIAHEAHVTQKAAEILPPGELPRVDHHAPKRAIGRLDPRVSRRVQRIEILRPKPPVGLDKQNAALRHHPICDRRLLR